jgi:hypothetical protein
VIDNVSRSRFEARGAGPLAVERCGQDIHLLSARSLAHRLGTVEDEGEDAVAGACPHCGAGLPIVRDAFCPACGNDLAEAPSRPLGQGHSGQPGGSTGEPLEVWYATEARARGWGGLFWHDDRGTLAAWAQGLRFAGRRGPLSLSQVKAVRLTGPVAVTVPAVLLLGGIGAFLLLVGAGALTGLTFSNPITYVLLVLANVFALASWPWSWARVDYLDENGAPRTGYFTAASMLHRWAGRTREMVELARQQAGRPPSPPGHSP